MASTRNACSIAPNKRMKFSHCDKAVIGFHMHLLMIKVIINYVINYFNNIESKYYAKMSNEYLLRREIFTAIKNELILVNFKMKPIV